MGCAACQRNRVECHGLRAPMNRVEAFGKLQIGMTQAAVLARVGPPDRATGSGLAIDVYQLQDGSSVWIGYARDRLLYVKHFAADGSEKVLVGDGTKENHSRAQ